MSQIIITNQTILSKFIWFQSETEKMKTVRDKKVSLMSDKKNDLLVSHRLLYISNIKIMLTEVVLCFICHSDYLTVVVKTTFMLVLKSWRSTTELFKLVTKLWLMALSSFCFYSLAYIGSSSFSMSRLGALFM